MNIDPTGEPNPRPYAWGLDRIDQRNLPLDTRYVYQNDGQGVKS